MSSDARLAGRDSNVAEWDAAYVLGVLTADDAAEYELWRSS
jgi:hypothetical protein